eukprot:EC721923.1.p1 GENE.EC721923.1~~EC721923.1.p1  ORF type:complete len:143 (+),score=25.87 EC721923.1:39-467(+)
MSGETHWGTIGSAVVEEIDKLRLSRAANRALLLKIDKPKLELVVDSVKDNVTLEDIADELSESQPCYIVYSYKFDRDDGRVQYPLLLIFYMPQACPIDLNMLSTNTKRHVMDKFQLSRSFDVQNLDTLTNDWLQTQCLIIFR